MVIAAIVIVACLHSSKALSSGLSRAISTLTKGFFMLCLKTHDEILREAEKIGRSVLRKAGKTEERIQEDCAIIALYAYVNNVTVKTAIKTLTENEQLDCQKPFAERELSIFLTMNSDGW